MNKKVFITLLAIILTGGIIFTGVRLVLAETSGSSPESGVTSKIKTIYTSLTGLSHGSDAAGAWGDWGAYWNRLRSAAEFTPSGDATATDVKNGKTYNSNSRTGSTGTYPNPTNCVTMQYADNHASATPANNCNLAWEVASPAVTGDDMKDPRTSLVWSQLLKNEGGTVTFALNGYSPWTWNGTQSFTVTAANATAGATYTNNGQTFTVITTITGGTTLNTSVATAGAPAASGTLTKASGTGDATITFSAVEGLNNAALGGKTATQLCADRGNGWRLPTQIELMQAWIDGAYFNLTAAATVTHTITEATATTVYFTTMSAGTTATQSKIVNAYVRCVR